MRFPSSTWATKRCPPSWKVGYRFFDGKSKLNVFPLSGAEAETEA
jgi:hypothetical protein